MALFLKKSLGWISLALLSRDIYYKTPSFSFVAGKKTYDQLKNQSSYQHKKMIKLHKNLDRVIESDPWLKANCNAYSPVDVIALN